MDGRKNIRLPHYNYTENGYYFVTVLAKLREDILSDKESLIKKELLD